VTDRSLKLAALAAIIAVAAGWVLYKEVWATGSAHALAYRDVTPQFHGLQPRREEVKLFGRRDWLDKYLRFADPSHAIRLPPIDFTREEAVLVASGPRSSTGYTLDVVRAVEERGRVVITVRENAPTLRDPGRPTVTYPYRVLVFHKTGKAVNVVWQGRR
jgi:hypothetical protein